MRPEARERLDTVISSAAGAALLLAFTVIASAAALFFAPASAQNRIYAAPAVFAAAILWGVLFLLISPDRAYAGNAVNLISWAVLLYYLYSAVGRLVHTWSAEHSAWTLNADIFNFYFSILGGFFAACALVNIFFKSRSAAPRTTSGKKHIRSVLNYMLLIYCVFMLEFFIFGKSAAPLPDSVGQPAFDFVFFNRARDFNCSYLQMPLSLLSFLAFVPPGFFYAVRAKKIRPPLMLAIPVLIGSAANSLHLILKTGDFNVLNILLGAAGFIAAVIIKLLLDALYRLRHPGEGATAFYF